MELKRIGPVSAARISGALYALFGLIFGLLMALFSLLGFGAAAQSNPELGLFSLVLGVGAVIVLPLLYGAMGFIACLVMVLLYNWLASLPGGVTLELEGPHTAPPD